MKGIKITLLGQEFTILLNGWIFPIGEASAVEGLLSTGPTPSSFYMGQKDQDEYYAEKCFFFQRRSLNKTI